MASIPAQNIDFFQKTFGVNDSRLTQLTTLELYDHKKLLLDFLPEEIYINHLIFKHEKQDGRCYKIREYRSRCPVYLQLLIDDIEESSSFADLKKKRPRLAGFGEQLALAAGYSAKCSISQFTPSVKRRIFITFCRNQMFHKKVFFNISLKERFSFYEDLLIEDDNQINHAFKLREYFN